MQTLIAILVVLAAVAYVAWEWMPRTWRNAVLLKRAPVVQPMAPTCPACATCGGCGKGA
ncbi:MAG: hypothetical protein JNM62_03745 [Flavobacteriales bacterium]|nr:hypothetical protein [Flavobacteriales bacterium]